MEKVVLVTGGTSGIGFETAKKFLDLKYKVIVCSEKEYPEFELTNSNSSATFFQCDIANEESVIKLKDEIKNNFGKLDILIANAGIQPPHCGIDEVSEEMMNKIISTNLKGTFFCLRAFGKLIQETSEDGSIVATTSVDGLIGEPFNPIYSATKAGIVSLVKSFARHFNEPLVRVNGVAPGLIDTPLTSATGEDPAMTTDLSVIKRIGNPDEIANAIVFLSSNKASFITGQILTVDGGFTLK